MGKGLGFRRKNETLGEKREERAPGGIEIGDEERFGRGL